MYTCGGWLGCDDSLLCEDWHVQVLYHNKTKQSQKLFNTRLYTHINTLDATFTINIKVQAKERMTGIKISCKHYRSPYIFRGKSNAPKLRALYIKYCTSFIKVIKYAKTHQCGRFIEKFNNRIENTWIILKLFWNYCFLLYQNFSFSQVINEHQTHGPL